MSRVNAEVIKNTRSAVVCRQFYFIAYNGMGINEGGMVNGAMSRKVEITLNSAVSLVQTLQPLLFIPCYKSGGGWCSAVQLCKAKRLKGTTKVRPLQPPLAYNYPIHAKKK
jgi:hypothetical protein